LAAPQAGLISSLAQGVISGGIDWSLIRNGAIIGVVIIALNELLSRTTKNMSLPPLAVGLGIYLPTQSTLMIVVGAIVGWMYDRRADRTARPEATKQLGVLLASGLIVGESVVLIVITAIVAFSSISLALVGPAFETAATILGGAAFVLVGFLMYRWILRMGNSRTSSHLRAVSTRHSALRKSSKRTDVAP
jgi:membrane glycosyltransferase